MSVLRTAFEIALERAGASDGGIETGGYLPEQDGILIDPDRQPPSPWADFFVTDMPSKVRGSRAMSNDEKKRRLLAPPLADGRGLELTYEGPFLTNTGYAKMNLAILRKLDEAGAVVRTIPVDSRTDVDGDTESMVRGMESNEVAPGTPKILGMTVPSSYGHGGRKIIYTMMETSGGVHEEYIEKLNLMDEVWVPSETLADLLEASGMRSDIAVMPLGVDTTAYSPSRKPMSLPGNLRGFKFLSVASWIPRKGWDALIQAYCMEFTSDEDVSLVVCSRPHGNYTGPEGMIQEIRRLKESVCQSARRSMASMPHIAVHHLPIGEADMPSLYTACHCFVLLSRGEGMGLPYLEAGACGLPVIGTLCTAQAEFLNEENSFPVAVDGMSVHRATGGATGNLAKFCKFYDGQSFPVLGKKAIMDAGSQMRLVFEGYSDAKTRADRFRAEIIDRFTWNHTANDIMARLLDIREDRT